MAARKQWVMSEEDVESIADEICVRLTEQLLQSKLIDVHREDALRRLEEITKEDLRRHVFRAITGRSVLSS